MALQDDMKTSDDENLDDGVDNPKNSDAVIAEEYDVLDSKLDELNVALDLLEKKNDSIQEQLKELLQANKDIRQEILNANSDGNN